MNLLIAASLLALAKSIYYRFNQCWKRSFRSYIYNLLQSINFQKNPFGVEPAISWGEVLWWGRTGRQKDGKTDGRTATWPPKFLDNNKVFVVGLRSLVCSYNIRQKYSNCINHVYCQLEHCITKRKKKKKKKFVMHRVKFSFPSPRKIPFNLPSPSPFPNPVVYIINAA